MSVFREGSFTLLNVPLCQANRIFVVHDVIPETKRKLGIQQKKNNSLNFRHDSNAKYNNELRTMFFWWDIIEALALQRHLTIQK